MRRIAILLAALLSAPTATAIPRFDPPGLAVVDGHSITIDHFTRIKLINIQAPLMAPSARCLREAHLGELARAKLIEVLGWGPVEVARNGARDSFGRELAWVRVHGDDGNVIDAGDVLVRWGLAVRAGTGEPATQTWCIEAW